MTSRRSPSPLRQPRRRRSLARPLALALPLLLADAALATAAPASPAGGPAAVCGASAVGSPAADSFGPMPASPELLARLGREGVRKLIGEQTPAAMYTEMRDLRARSAAKRLSGTGTALVILWTFTDHPADQVAHPNSAYDELLFSTGTHPTGSMNDYYREVSYGAFGVDGGVVGWTVSAKLYDDPSYVPHDATHTRVMLQDAITQLDPLVNFALYDNDGPDGVPHSGDDDGLVDALFFVHAGPGQEQTGDPHDIWSHAWALPSGGQLTNDGVRVYRYSVEPEETITGSLVAIGVYCHEYGHVLGLPDLYDTDYSSSGVGEWCLMSGGSWNYAPGQEPGASPAHPLAWCKAQLGWVDPAAITATTAGLTVPPAETGAYAFRFFRGGVATGDEYFLAENRRPLGFDSGLVRRQVRFGLPQPEGLLLLHVDESQTSNAGDKHRLVDVIEATPWWDSVSGAWVEHLDGPYVSALALKLNERNRGDNGDLWPGFAAASADSSDWVAPRGRDRFADDTAPSAQDYFCDPTDVALENVALSGADVTVDVIIGAAKRAPAKAAVVDRTWTFETGDDGWSFCNSYVHFDQTQAGGCPGGGGLWFGLNEPSWVCPPGYGNGWSDFTWHPVLVQPGAGVTIRHKYDMEADYDFGFIEVRRCNDPGYDWVPVAVFSGDSGGCLTWTYTIPAQVIADALVPELGAARLDLRLRFTSDGGWSAQDGSFCGIGWWVDELTVSNVVTAADEPPPGAGLPALLLAPAPNPFNPVTRIRCHVPAGARQASLAVYDQRGRLVRTLIDGAPAPGWQEPTWDGRDAGGRAVGSGLYFARFLVDGAAQIQKLVLIK